MTASAPRYGVIRIWSKSPFSIGPSLYNERGADFSRIMNDDVLSRGGFILQKDVVEFEANLAALCRRQICGRSVGRDQRHPLWGCAPAASAPGTKSSSPAIRSSPRPNPFTIRGRDADCRRAGRGRLAGLARSDRSRHHPRTRAIMPVHVNGRVCKMDRILDIAARHGLEVFEDAAQAMGARFDGKGRRRDRPLGHLQLLSVQDSWAVSATPAPW
jgi:hypothetical protein